MKAGILVKLSATLMALALAALAAWLWLRPEPREQAPLAAEPAADDAPPNSSPLHGEIDAKDRAALRDLLREAPPAAAQEPKAP